MKLNWGTGIAIFYIAFMVFMIGFVVQSRKVDHSLVLDNYYEEDIRYQQKLDRIANSKALEQDLVISQINNKQVSLVFPDIPGDITGEVWFYKPDDNSKDFKLPVVADGQRTFIIDTGNLVPGLWRLKVEWQAADTGYYQEKELYL